MKPELIFKGRENKLRKPNFRSLAVRERNIIAIMKAAIKKEVRCRLILNTPEVT